MKGVTIGGLLCALASGDLFAQAPPSTDIYLARLVRSGGTLTMRSVRNLTRRAGYDNQPAFSADGRTLYFTSNRGDGQTDIWAIDLATFRQRRITRTPESEYSAAVTPDRRGISVVRVERDSTQRLWRFPLGGGRPCLVLDNLAPVGYYAWANDSTLAAFVLGQPSSLQIANIDARSVDTVARTIGRSLHRVPGGQRISFVDKADSAVWWIRAIDPTTRQVTPISPLPTGVEDYVWTARGELLSSNGKSTVMRWQPDAAHPNYAIWHGIGGLDSTVAGKITRLAVSPNGRWLAFVAEPVR